MAEPPVFTRADLDEGVPDGVAGRIATLEQ